MTHREITFFKNGASFKKTIGVNMIHPNLVKRAKRTRADMIGKHAEYHPRGITGNNALKSGTRVVIVEFEHRAGKDLTLVRVRNSDGVEYSVLFSDLGFIE